MKENPAGAWRALTGRYRSMIDEELSALAADFDDLTPMAQQALRDEMRLRKLGDPQSLPRPGMVKAGVRQRPGRTSPSTQFGFSLVSRVPDLIPDKPTDVPEGQWVEYTWKTPLCRCASDEQAWQISEVLRRAGIESWIEGAGTYGSSSGSQDTAIDDGNRRVVVAADQLDEARALISQPIPLDIVEQSKIAPPPYQPPVCPRCGAEDPVLQEIEPVNSWQCESCGAEWSDPSAESAEPGAGGR